MTKPTYEEVAKMTMTALKAELLRQGYVVAICYPGPGCDNPLSDDVPLATIDIPAGTKIVEMHAPEFIEGALQLLIPGIEPVIAPVAVTMEQYRQYVDELYMPEASSCRWRQMLDRTTTAARVVEGPSGMSIVKTADGTYIQHDPFDSPMLVDDTIQLERLGLAFATMDNLAQAVIHVYGAEDGQLVLDDMADNLNHKALAGEGIIIGGSEPQASVEILERVVADLGPELANPS